MSIFVKISANSYNVFLPHSIMFNLDKVKGILFDYGGTIDSNGMHWAEVIWMAYEALKVPVSKAVFRDAYVHGERTLGKSKLLISSYKLKTYVNPDGSSSTGADYDAPGYVNVYNSSSYSFENKYGVGSGPACIFFNSK